MKDDVPTRLSRHAFFCGRPHIELQYLPMSQPVQRPLYLTQAADKLAAALGENLLGVVLYGSHARGEAREDI
ncbi:MAG: nucleotidyltransferase domain-containing protein [Chloroflexi bacterium]|nr:nucleotidyltransferase domain-containing protein [Chloroflexota bacterium]